MDAQFYDLLHTTITVEPFVQMVGYGRHTYGPPVTYKCRLVKVQRPHRTGTAITVTASTLATIPGNADGTAPPLTPQDRYTLPSGEQPMCTGVEVFYDETGAKVDHLQVYLSSSVPRAGV